MAGISHKTVGTQMTQAEFEAADSHDLSALTQLGIGTATPFASVHSTDSASFGNLALSDRHLTRGIQVIHGRTIQSTDPEDVHGAVLIGHLAGIGGGATSKQIFGAEIQAETARVAGILPNSMIGINGIALYQSDQPISASYYVAGVNGIVQIDDVGGTLAGTIATAIAVRADAVQKIGTLGTITKAYGFYAKAQTVGASNYGIYSETAPSAANWDLYMNGGAKNYLKGNLGVGVDPSRTLHVAVNTATIGITNTPPQALALQQLGTGTDLYSLFFDSSTYLLGGIGFRNISHGAGSGDFGIWTRGYGFTNPALIILNDGKVGFNDAAPAEVVDVTGNINATGVYKIDDVQVVSNRVIDARCDDAINSGDATTDGVIDALRDAMIAHGLIAAA